MIDAFRSEFRYAPKYLAELLRRFDGDFLSNMRPHRHASKSSASGSAFGWLMLVAPKPLGVKLDTSFGIREFSG